MQAYYSGHGGRELIYALLIYIFHESIFVWPFAYTRVLIFTRNMTQDALELET